MTDVGGARGCLDRSGFLGETLDLFEALRTSGAVRQFRADAVPDDVVGSLLDWARYAPSGGNRQGWRVIVVKDAFVRSAIGDLYRASWREYMAYVREGLVPFAPSPDGRWNGAIVDLCEARQTPSPNAFADDLENVPVMLVVVAALPELAVTDVDLPRQSIVGGASVYPFVQNVLLAARGYGLGGVMTTVICRQEAAVKQLLDIPEGWAVAALVALGVPVRRATRLSRRGVEQFATWDRFSGPPFRIAGSGR